MSGDCQFQHNHFCFMNTLNMYGVERHEIVIAIFFFFFEKKASKKEIFVVLYFV